MSSDDYRYVEQDPSGPADGGELPTYDDLIAQNGPNSRYVIVRVRALCKLYELFYLDLEDGEAG